MTDLKPYRDPAKELSPSRLQEIDPKLLLNALKKPGCLGENERARVDIIAVIKAQEARIKWLTTALEHVTCDDCDKNYFECEC